MNIRLLFLFLFLCSGHLVMGQLDHGRRNQLRPGISYSYLPSWILDNLDPSIPANVQIFGLHGYQELWKESILVLGIASGRISIQDEPDQNNVVFVPVKLQKYFARDRKGFNLATGVVLNFCADCRQTFGGGFLHEISYSIFANPFQINVGWQILAGELISDRSIHVGGQLQVIYHHKMVHSRK